MKRKKSNFRNIDEGLCSSQSKKGDTFYSLTRFYNVTEDEIKELNPELSESLQPEMLLKIKPVGHEDEILIYQDTIQQNTTLQLAMLLPFRAAAYDTIDGKDIFKKYTSQHYYRFISGSYCCCGFIAQTRLNS